MWNELQVHTSNTHPHIHINRKFTEDDEDKKRKENKMRNKWEQTL